MKKIVLVVPNFNWTDTDAITTWHFIPYNLCLIAAVIENQYDVEIIDANLNNYSPEQFGEIITRLSPDVVGISVLMDKYGVTGHKAAEIVKEVNSEIITVFGGVYPTTNPELVARDDNIDFVVVGEGEYVFKDLLECLDKKTTPDLDGVWYKNKDEIIEKGRSAFIDDLDALPFPAYHLIDFKKYASNVLRNSIDRPPALPYLYLTTSRGCPQKCIFCQVESISGRKVRQRSPESMIDEILRLKQEYGIRSFTMGDDNFLAHKKKAKRFLSLLIEKKVDMKWKMGATAIFMLDDELITLLAKSGCLSVGVAIESGSKRVLKEIINKPVDLDKAKINVKKLKEAGIFVSSNFIVGFPGETWNEIRESLKYAEDLGADYCRIFNAVPLPKTRLFKLCKETGAFATDYNSLEIDWKHGYISTSEFTRKDIGILRAYEWDRINFTDKTKRKKIAEVMELSLEELDKIRKDTRNSLEL